MPEAAGRGAVLPAPRRAAPLGYTANPGRQGGAGLTMSTEPGQVHVVDSHTAGEPTRVVVAGGPDLGSGPLAARREVFRSRFDRFRSAVVNEPRGSDPVVGALLCPASDPSCVAGVLFFNNVGYLGMCGHGTIGLVATLAFLGRVGPGAHRIETPVGVVDAELNADGSVSVRNVPSYRWRARVPVEVEGHGVVIGDVAWGGNWFFLVGDHGQNLSPENVAGLTAFARRVRLALASGGVTGRDGAEIDHVELLGPATRPDADGRNFVLCPGGAYDRSPCGTGLSAALACLHADGALAPGRVWRQESIVGTVFEGSAEACEGGVIATIRGAAFVNARGVLILDERDPFCWGMR